MSSWTYHWFHLPTQTEGTRTTEPMMLCAFLRLLNEWNEDQPTTWKYWW